MMYTVVDQIREELKRRMLTGDWGLGSRIFEEDIAAELNVSRSAVREAIRLLEQEGLIVREAHRGLYVASPTDREAREVAHVRGVLEAEAVRLSPPPSVTLLDELDHIVRKLEAAEERIDRVAAAALDRSFHSLVVQSCENDLLLRKFHELDGQMAIFFHWSMAHKPEAIAGIAERHRALYQALTTSDAEVYASAVSKHYRNAIAMAQDLPETTHAVRELARRAT